MNWGIWRSTGQMRGKLSCILYYAIFVNHNMNRDTLRKKQLKMIPILSQDSLTYRHSTSFKLGTPSLKMLNKYRGR